jgi:rhodanese-related sulfurtransferase
MFPKTLCSIGVALGLLISVAAISAHSESLTIENATLGERDQPAPDISTAELRRILADHNATVLDTRTMAEFDAGHIPGAKIAAGEGSQQLTAIENLVNGNKAAPLVLYCNGPFCQASRKLAKEMASAGFSNLRRYQLGMPVWRALGGPVVIEKQGVFRILKDDRTAVLIDARAHTDFVKATLAGAVNLPVEDFAAGKIKSPPLPIDDFNRRVILFGGHNDEAARLAGLLAKRPWHNVMYYSGRFEDLQAVRTAR